MALRTRLVGVLGGLAVAAVTPQPACMGPDITLGIFAVGSLSGGTFALTEGEIGTALGLTALGVGLGVAFYFVAEGLYGQAPRLDRQEVARALARGAGAVVDELAGDLALTPAEASHLGPALRAARARLVAAMPDPAPARGDWLPFYVALREVLAADPVLAPRLAALDARSAPAASRVAREHAPTPR